MNILNTNHQIKEQAFKIKDLFRTTDMVKELDFCDQDSFPLLYAFKVENDTAERVLMHEVTDDY
jgi:lipopolysaccharide biosynthesis protein